MWKLEKKSTTMIFMLLSLLFFSIATINNVFAADSDFEIDENGVLIRYNGLGGDVVIPDGVTSIGTGAFWECFNLTNIDIPDSVTSIGYNAFIFCENLTDINMPNSITTIDGSAFAFCRGLTNIHMSNSISSIGDFAFSNCISLATINIPDSVINIGGAAFADCNSLTSIDIPDSVVNIGPSAFSNCNNLVSITIPNSVTCINDFLFSGCTSLLNVNISNSVTYIGSNAFYKCYSLEQINIPDSIANIGYLAFDNCENLKSIFIYSKDVEFDDYAFPTSSASITLYGYKDSTTEEYALKYGYKFQELENPNRPLISISLAKTNINLAIGKSTLNHVIYNPDDTTDDKTVKWSSSDTSIARVLTNGKIQALSKGNVVITAKVGDLTATCNVTVN